jgi:predicted dithiol-disulfide oxidoreductase (DUF899 family)
MSRDEWVDARRRLLSVFCKDTGGDIFHTYSTYARGLDPMNVAYQLLDLVPKGRDETGLPHPMAWVGFHDKYELEPSAVYCRKSR